MSSPKMLEQGILVISSGKEMIAIYPYRDADGSRITLETKDAVIISCGLPGISEQTLTEAAGRARDYIFSVCGDTQPI